MAALAAAGTTAPLIPFVFEDDSTTIESHA
jgi:hypothetical protein